MKNQTTPPRSFNTVRRSNREQRLKRRRQQRIVLLSVFAVVILILTATLGLLIGEFAEWLSSKPKPGPQPDPDPGLIVYTQLTQQNSGIHRGELIIVNKSNAYVFPTVNTLKSIYENRTKVEGANPYRLKDSNARLQAEAMDAIDALLVQYYSVSKDPSVEIGSTYRSEEDQRALGGTVKAGYSDHHTGYCLELHTASGGALESDHWIYKHCAEYGFVVRYPAGKEALTDVKDYTNCFRYVGIPHAVYMSANNLCMEEYISLLQKNYAGNTHLSVKDAGGRDYEIYYVSASDGEISTLSVPSNYQYSISGDNMSGFIITVDLSQPITETK